VVSQTGIVFVYKNSIYFALLVNLCTPDDVIVVRNILSFYIRILCQFAKPPSDTLLRSKYICSYCDPRFSFIFVTVNDYIMQYNIISR
jgi:hypothetical protein